MSNFKKKILSVSALTTMIVILITAIVASFAVTKNASAAMSVDEIYKNVMGNLIYKCYNDSEMYSTVSGADYNSTSDNADTAFGNFVLKGGSGLFYIPTGVGPGNEIAPSTSDGTRINCKQLFLGGDGIGQGLFALFGKEKPSPHSSTLNTELKNIGYTKESGGSGDTTCINAFFGAVGFAKEEDSSAGSICWKDDEIAEKISWPDFVGAAKFTYSSNAVSVDSLVNSGAYGSYVGIKFKDTSTGHMCDVTASPVTAFSSRTWQDVINDLGAGSCTINNVGGVSYEIAFTVSRTGEGSEIFSDFSWLSPAAAANTAKNYFTGFNSAKTFTVEDRYELYKAYLNNVYGATYGSCKPKSELSDWRVPDATGATTYYVYYDGLYYNVSIPDDKKSLMVSSFGDDTVYMKGYWNLENLLQSIWNMGFAETGTCESGGGGGGGGEPEMEKPGDVSLDSSGIVDCNQLENLGAMQWLLCPVMNNEQYTASWIDNMTQEWLEVDTDKLYKDDAVEKVWKNIRVIANVVMVVFLLVIIFSQVTGYGIDNYGVKKMLPRLIVMAIIINLSFVICQLAIDLSNIAGVGLRNMFTSISMTEGSEMAGTSFLGDMVMGLFASASTGGAAAVSGFTIATTLGVEIAVAVVVAVIVLLLVVLVAVMVLFLMLGAREIIIIVCIILSPLAFAAFILPNTQNLFKKWWELFKAALIIFPICGAMAGISNMLRGMYSTSSPLHMWGYAVLMILPYLGFFLMPMLLKNAISALGKVGGALTSLGNTIRSGGKAIGQAGMKIGQNTNAFKDWQEKNAQARLERIRAKVQKKGDKASIGDKRRALEAGRKLQEMRTRDELAKLGLSDESIAARAMSIREAQELKNYSDQYTNLTRAQMGDELDSAIKAYDGDRSDTNALRLQAAIIAAEGKGMNKEMLSADKGFGGIKFDAKNGNDAKILSRLAGSSDKVLSQYGIQMSKLATPGYKHVDMDANGNKVERDLTEAERNISLNDFIGSQAEVKLSKVSSDKGASWLNVANDDTWDAILTNNPNAIDTHTLITAATNTTDGKVLAKVNDILAARKGDTSEKYEMSTAELSKLKSSTLGNMNSSIYDKAVASIKGDPNSAANQQILNSMDQDVRRQLGLDDASLVQARGMESGYVNKTAGDVYEEAAKANAERTSDPGTYMRDMSNSSVAAVKNALQNGSLSREMAHNMLTSNDQHIRDQLSNNAELRKALEAGASGMMPTSSNPTPNIPGGGQLNWNNSADVDRAAQSYRTQAGGMKGDYVAKDAAQVAEEAYKDNAKIDKKAAKQQAKQAKQQQLNRMADSMEKIANQGWGRGDNNGGQGFNGGAGI